MKIKYHLYIALISCLTFLGCTPETVDPIGFKAVDYTTRIDEDQQFDYYYDDGVKVGDALGHSLVSIKTRSGSFSSEEPIILRFVDEINSLPDSIIPFSYFFNTSYLDPLSTSAEFSIHYDFPYTNAGHKNQFEESFFKERLSQMKLYKLEPEPNGELYWDPLLSVSEVPFTIDSASENIVFQTDDLGAGYSLCWNEKPWEDSIYFSITDGSKSNEVQLIESGMRTRNGLNTEGTYLENNVLIIEHTETVRAFESDTNFIGWNLGDLSISIKNPEPGIVDHSDIVFDCSIRTNVVTETRLQLTTQSNVILDQIGDYNEPGILRLSGKLLLETSQDEIPVSLKIYFTRQR